MAQRGTLSIASGGTTSAIVDAPAVAPAVSLLIMAPATLPEATKVQVAPDRNGTFRDLQTNGSDVVLAAGKATQITVMGGAAWRLLAAQTAGQRDFDYIINPINTQWGTP